MRKLTKRNDANVQSVEKFASERGWVVCICRSVYTRDYVFAY